MNNNLPYNKVMFVREWCGYNIERFTGKKGTVNTERMTAAALQAIGSEVGSDLNNHVYGIVCDFASGARTEIKRLVNVCYTTNGSGQCGSPLAVFDGSTDAAQSFCETHNKLRNANQMNRGITYCYYSFQF